MEKKTIWDLHRMTPDNFKKAPKIPVVMVLDNIRSLSNVGAILRTCDAFAVERVLLCGVTGTPPSPEIHKTALGAEDSVEWMHCDDTLEAVIRLKGEGYTICSLEQVKGSVSLESFVPDGNAKYALVAGNEVKGVAQDVVDASDVCLEIPQFGTKHSLNVSVSAGIALWQLFSHMLPRL